MDRQIQCHNPRCGGYKVDSAGPYFEDPITHKRLHLNSAIGCILPLIIVIAAFLVGVALSAADAGRQGAPMSWMTFLGFVAATPIWLIAMLRKRAKLKQFAHMRYHCTCRICGMKFDHIV